MEMKLVMRLITQSEVKRLFKYKDGKLLRRVKSKRCNVGAEQSLNWSGCDNSSPAFQYMKDYVNHFGTRI